MAMRVIHVSIILKMIICLQNTPIDEAEDGWSQHNAKKLIDTSITGLRASIPKDFPYFHVEFGLHGGFVHVIDDEKDFRNSFGLNVIRGMLKLPAEDMHSHRKHETVERQKQAVASFARDWQLATGLGAF
nr:CWF19-like protein 2 isoform X1 [Ipomoea trifida]